MADDALDDEARERFHRLLQQEAESANQPSTSKEASAPDDDPSSDEDPPEDNTLPDIPIPPEMLVEGVVNTATKKKKKREQKPKEERRPTVAWEVDIKERARDLRKKKESYRSIAKTLQVSHTNVIRWCKGKGMKKMGRHRLLQDTEEESIANYIKFRSRCFQGLKTKNQIAEEVQYLLQDSIRSTQLKGGKPSEYPFFTILYHNFINPPKDLKSA